MNTNAPRESHQVQLPDAVATGAFSCAPTVVLVLHPYVHEFTCGCPLAPVFKCVSGCALTAVLVLWGVLEWCEVSRSAVRSVRGSRGGPGSYPATLGSQVKL